MSQTEQKLEALEQEAVAEASANPQADAPKKNAVAAEPSHIASMNNAEDLGPAVVKPTDSNPDATKKTKQVSGDAQQKNQGAADPMPKLKESEESKSKEDVKEEDKEDEKEEGYGMKKASYHMKKEETETEIEKIDVSADVAALVKDEDLSENFKNKAATIFEAAVNAKVKEQKEIIEKAYEEKLQEDLESQKGALVEKVDSYLNYVVEEWMKENSIAIERGIKGEIAEDFISGLKKLF